MRRAILAALGCLLGGVVASAAPPEGSFFYPPGVQRGQSVTVQAGGNLQPALVSVWVEPNRGLTVVPADGGKFEITASPDAVPGVHWLRLYNSDGASPPRPFVVGTIPDLLEKEPNDRLSEANEVPPPGRVINGRLEKAGDVDLFSIELTAGQTLLADVDAAHPLNAPVDIVLQLLDARGFVVGQNHDDFGLDPRLVFTAPTAGRYTARLFGWSSTPSTALGLQGDNAYVYRLTLTTGPVAELAWPQGVSSADRDRIELRGTNVPPGLKPHLAPLDEPAGWWTLFHPEAAGSAPFRQVVIPTAIEQEPNDLEHPQEVELPRVITGSIDPPGDVDVFLVKLAKGQRGTARIEARSLGWPLDPTLSLMNAEGVETATVDDAGTNRDPELTLTAPADGEYRVIVRDLFSQGSPRHAYRLTLSLIENDIALTIPETQWIVTPEKPVEVTVTVDRRGGFAGEIEIGWEGLPDDWKLVPIVSMPKDATAKTVKLALPAGPSAFNGPVRIVGRVRGDTPLERIAGGTLVGRETPWTSLWVTRAAQDTTPPPAKKR